MPDRLPPSARPAITAPRRAGLRAVLLAAALLGAATAASAQEGGPGAPPAPDGPAGGADLMQRGMQSILEGLLTEMQPALDEMGRALTELRPMAEQLMRLVDDIGNYEAPVILENGDILIRRKPAPPKPGEIDL